MNLRHNIEKVL